MATSVTPSLFTSKDLLVTAPDRVADLLMYAISNPGSTTSMWANSELSIPKLVNTYEDNLSTLVSTLESRLNSVLTTIFENEGITAMVSYDVIDTDKNIYKLIINVVYSDGSSVLNTSSINVDENGILTLNLG